MVIGLTRILAGTAIFTSLIMAPYTPSYARGITSGTTWGSTTQQKNNYTPTQKNTPEQRNRAYKILEKIDPTPYNAGTKSIKILEYYGKKKMNDLRARGGLLDGSPVRHRQ